MNRLQRFLVPIFKRSPATHLVFTLIFYAVVFPVFGQVLSHLTSGLFSIPHPVLLSIPPAVVQFLMSRRWMRTHG